jgi:hypothetical protein
MTWLNFFLNHKLSSRSKHYFTLGGGVVGVVLKVEEKKALYPRNLKLPMFQSLMYLLLYTI